MPNTVVIFGKVDLSAVLARLDELGAQMSELSDAVAALKARVDQDVAHLQEVISDLSQQLLDALANDAADAATIAAKQSELDAVQADVAQAVSEISAIDPVADFPPAEPPAEPPAG